MCAKAGVFRWFVPSEHQGFGWTAQDQTRGYLALAKADLTTTFVITQLMGAIKRIIGSGNRHLIDRWVEPLLAGNVFATVGISHLTTSRRHLTKPVLSATADGDGFRLNGMAPWVTGAPHADAVVVGATLEDGRQLLAAVPTDLPGVMPGKGIDLVALSPSCTDRFELDNVAIDPSMLIAGPVEEVMKTGTGGTAGGLQTSTLAIGLASAAVEYLSDEASRRDELQAAATEMNSELHALQEELLRAVSGELSCDISDIRQRANGFVLRSTQAALTAAKGAGYAGSHPVGRWCRQSLFFLVWSCPQPVAQAHLCELAGIQ